MNQRARVVELPDTQERKDALVPVAVPRPSETSPKLRYHSLTQLLSEAQRHHQRGVVTAFAAVSPGDSVGDVTYSVAWELSKVTEEKILLCTAETFTNATWVGVRPAGAESPDPVFRMEDPGNHYLSRVDTGGLDELRRQFGFVLVACMPLLVAPNHGLLKAVDHAVLVATAGKTTFDEVNWASNSVASLNGKVLGWVLNQRPRGDA